MPNFYVKNEIFIQEKTAKTVSSTRVMAVSIISH
ncbi:MAG: hypothetical protein RLZZ210_680 [Pseudomonadota bacterium]